MKGINSPFFNVLSKGGDIENNKGFTENQIQQRGYTIWMIQD